MENIRYHALTPEKWADFENLFGERGACGGCWCMTWRLKSSDYEKSKGAGNKSLMHELVQTGAPAGVLAYDGDQAVGWCAVAPREHYVRLENSRVLSRVDEQPVWSIVCFFIQKNYRGRGLSVQLIRAAAEYAKSQGAKIVEAYPQIPKNERMPEVFAFTGLASAFAKAGFKEVARRSETRPIFRIEM